ncbi:MAG: hypothetical protein IKY27_10910 [Bacteroidales bacterium]|nr:hypothetical protein [Bacteroidales bacterium]
MKKILGFTFVLMTLGFMSCSPSPVGRWIEPTGGTEEQGFILNQDGSASSINMGFVEFTKWEKNGDKLILTGRNKGMVKREFVDTMKIEKLSKTELTLSQAGYSVTYLKN